MPSCPSLIRFGETVAAPAVGGPSTFSSTVPLGADSDEVGLAALYAMAWDTASTLQVATFDLRLSWVDYGAVVGVVPTAARLESAPVIERIGQVGRLTLGFPVPLPAPPSFSTGRRMQLEVLLENISVTCSAWRVYLQTAVRRGGEWHY